MDLAPETSDGARASPWVLPNARFYHSVSSSCHFGILGRKLGGRHSSALEIRENLGPSIDFSPAGRHEDGHLDGDAKRVDNEWSAESSGVPLEDPQQNARLRLQELERAWLSLSGCEICSRCNPSCLARSGNAMRHRQWPAGSGGWPAGRLVVCFWQAVVSSRALERMGS